MKALVSSTAVVAAFLTLPFAATAAGGYAGGVVSAGPDAWSHEACYDPCMNGDVSATGMFSSQLAEDKAMARMSMIDANES